MNRVADIVARWIADAGVRDVFLLPGGGAMYLNDGIACEPRLKAIPCHHEQACGIAAEAYGRVSDAGFGVAMVTTGPGATNVLTPVAGAWIESLPLMVISGQVKRADTLKGRPIRQGGVQEVDVLTMVASVCKFSASLDDPLDVLMLLNRARHEMLSGRPGPVWIDIPLDVQAAPVDGERLRIFEPPSLGALPFDAAALHQIQQLIADSERPLILAGHGVRISGAAKAFADWVQQLRIPCVFTWNASDLLPWDHELYVGRPGVVAARAPNFAVQNCDLLIAIGARLDNVVTAYDSAQFARAARKVVIDVDEHELARHHFKPQVSIHADAHAFLRAWKASGFEIFNSWASWTARCRDWKLRYLPGDRDTDPPESSPVTHIGFVEAISRSLPADSLIVTGSSGLAVEFFYTAFRNKPGQRFFLTSGLGAMGYGLAAAIGACLGAGRKPMFCIESDGSLMLNIQELATIRALNLPIAIIVMNNFGYASIRNTQRNYFASRFVGSESSSSLEIPSLAAVAQAFGIKATIGENLSQLEEFFVTWNTQEPMMLDFRLATDETLSPKVAAIPQKDGTMLSMPLEDMSPLLSLEALEKEMNAPLLPQSRAARGVN
jgi:acetolactate synthase-1/2/3 large subunit